MSPPPLFNLLLFVVAVLSGATASVAGFGIGSLLTPLLATQLGMTTAIAAVAIPHAVATTVRGWRLRRNIDWGVMRSFGFVSAAGGLAGALLFTRFSNASLTLVLALLLIATSVAGLTNWTRRVRVGRAAATGLGLASGLFGGIAGNQGGLRTAALFTFPLGPAAFIATSTAIGVLVDAARMPIYLWRAGSTLLPFVIPIGIATAGVLVGTFAGERILLGLSPERFRLVVSTLVGLLGVWLLVSMV